MRYTNRRSNKAKKALVYIGIILVIAVSAFVSLSPIFEKNSPNISLKDEIYWNVKTPLKVNLSDDTEIKSYSIVYSDNSNEVELDTKVLNSTKSSIDLNIIAPKLPRDAMPQDVSLKIEVYDTSKWNFFMGNKLTKEIKVKVDRKAPVANVINHSYLIKQGGSAAIVVEVRDDNLEDFYISFNGLERFELIPFYKKNFYMAIIAWPIDIEEFRRVNLIAIDKARNKTVTKVPLYIKELNPKIDKLKISDNFIDKVSKNVLVKMAYDIPDNQVEIFIKTNRDLRERNVKDIKDITRKNMDKSLVEKFNFKAVKQLKSSLKFAGYGERRHYLYKGEKIDEAWHLGMDWASVKQARIYTTNPGKVIYNDYLGIYGDSIIIDHGYGIATLYAHTSRTNVELNEEVKADAQIANTGKSGAVFGDHLHFGVIVQGIEVNPSEWLSRYWVRENITKIINNAKKKIEIKK